jgi:hypothetical protein
MATTFINLANYQTLNQFGILSGDYITTVGAATLNNGYYGSSTNAYTLAPGFITQGSPSGQSTSPEIAGALDSKILYKISK